MRATFDITGDIQLRICEEPYSNGFVRLEVHNPMRALPLSSEPAEPPSTLIVALSLKKSVVRAIGSALMGAAADA